MQLTVETLIDAPREAIFAGVLDIEQWPQRISGITRIEKLTPGPVQVGTRFRETREMFGREATEEMAFAEIVAPEFIVLTAESHGTRYRTEHHFIAEGAGTRVRMIFGGTPVTLTARLLTPLALVMKGHVRRLLEADLADVKRWAEQRA